MMAYFAIIILIGCFVSGIFYYKNEGYKKNYIKADAVILDLVDRNKKLWNKGLFLLACGLSAQFIFSSAILASPLVLLAAVFLLRSSTPSAEVEFLNGEGLKVKGVSREIFVRAVEMFEPQLQQEEGLKNKNLIFMTSSNYDLEALRAKLVGAKIPILYNPNRQSMITVSSTW